MFYRSATDADAARIAAPMQQCVYPGLYAGSARLAERAALID